MRGSNSKNTRRTCSQPLPLIWPQVIFLIYLYQRHIYPVDRTRELDEEGNPVQLHAWNTDGSPKD